MAAPISTRRLTSANAGPDASDDAPRDAFDAEAPDSALDAGCVNDAPCDLDDDPCTRDVCRDGECVAGAACVSPQMCDAELGCVCPFSDLKVCGDLCISTPTCCDDSDCTAPETCPGPGSFCACPVGFRPCDGECIPGSSCCTTADCPRGTSCVDNFCEGP